MKHGSNTDEDGEAIRGIHGRGGRKLSHRRIDPSSESGGENRTQMRGSCRVGVRGIQERSAINEGIPSAELELGHARRRVAMRSDLSGKVSLVTGAARGIGQAIADRLAANGSRVVYTDIDADEACAVAAHSHSPGSMGLALDVTKPDQIAQVIDEVVGSGGRSTSWSTTRALTAWCTGSRSTSIRDRNGTASWPSI